MYKIFYSPLFYFMLCHFVLMVVLFVLNFKYLIKEFKKINKKVLLILLIIFLFGSYLRNSEYWLGTHTDGYVAQESAKMWILHGEHFKSCGLGNQIECEIPEQVLAPPGFPLLIVIAHLIFGLNSLNASVISAVLSSLIIILVFLNSWLLFNNPYNSYGHGGFFALHYSGILIQGKALFLQLFNNWGDFYHYNFIFSFFFLFGFFILIYF